MLTQKGERVGMTNVRTITAKRRRTSGFDGEEEGKCIMQERAR